MSSVPKPEGLPIVLTQVLVAFLTLFTVVPLLAILEVPGPFGELAISVIVFAAWSVVISMAVPVFRKRPVR